MSDTAAASARRAPHSSLCIVHSALCIIVAALAAFAASAAPKIVYVAPGGTGDGTSWTDAMGDVSNAYASAAAFADGGFDRGEVWIKSGRYLVRKPIEMQTGVAVRGGFLGTEASASSATRDNLTILCGDPSADDYWKPDGTAPPAANRQKIWTLGETPVFNPPNPNAANEFWSIEPGGNDCSWCFQGTQPEVAGAEFTGLTFTSFSYHAIHVTTNAGYTVTVSNCNFYAASASQNNNEGYAIYLKSAEARVHDCVFHGGVAGLMMVTHSAAPQTNIVTGCTFRDIWRNAVRVYDNNAGNVWRISRCRFYRNYCNDQNLCPGIYLGRQKDALQCHDFIASDCVFSECRLSRNSTGVLGYNGGYGGTGPYIFERCDFSDNVGTNTTADFAAVCRTGILGTRYLFRDCSFRNNRVYYSGTGRAASVLMVNTSNSYINFLNCTFTGNFVSAIGEGGASTCGTLVLLTPNQRLSVVHSVFDGNYVGGGATNAEIAVAGDGYNSKLVVAANILNGDAADYSPVRGPHHNTGYMYLCRNFMSNFDQGAVGPAKFIRCADNLTGFDPVIDERLRTTPDRANYAIGAAAHRSPLWRGAPTIQFWHTVASSASVKIARRDAAANGTTTPWTQLYVDYGNEGNLSDDAAAAYGFVDGNDGVPDALGNPRPDGKIAYGPLNFAVPTILSVR